MRKGEIEGRIDPDMILYKRKLLEFKFPVKQLKQLLKGNPQYGSNQAGIDRNSINETRYIRITDINEYGLLKNTLGVTAEIVDEKYVLKNNDILFARSGATVGKAYLHKSKSVDYKCFYAGYMIRFLVDENLLLPEFLFYYTQLNVYKEWVRAIQRAAGQPNINAEEYKSLSIPVPLIEEQNQILAVFETAYAEKKQKEAEAAALLARIDGYLLAELGINLPAASAPKKCFYTRASKVSGGRFDPFYHQIEFENINITLKTANSEVHTLGSLAVDLKNGAEFRTYSDEGYRYLRVTDLSQQGISDKNMRFVNVPEIPERLKLNHDCILISRSGSLGLVNVVTDEIVDSILSSHIFKVQLNTKLVLPAYLESYLRSTIGQKQIFRNNNGGVIPELNQSALRSIKIVLPSIEKQIEIADHVSAIRTQAKQLQQQAEAELDQAKQQVERMILGDH